MEGVHESDRRLVRGLYIRRALPSSADFPGKELYLVPVPVVVPIPGLVATPMSVLAPGVGSMWLYGRRHSSDHSHNGHHRHALGGGHALHRERAGEAVHPLVGAQGKEHVHVPLSVQHSLTPEAGPAAREHLPYRTAGRSGPHASDARLQSAEAAVYRAGPRTPVFRVTARRNR